MKLKTAFFALSLVVAQAVALTARAQTAPPERRELTLSRTAQSGPSLAGELSANLFKTVTVQVPYEVTVPYEDTEEYTVEVPYEATETYTERVPYQDTEYYTERVPYQETEYYQEQVPYTETVTEYVRQQVCRDVPDTRRECNNEPVCRTEPSNERTCAPEELCRVDREGRRVCVTREVCRDIPGPGRRVCTDNQVCRNVPTTRRECSFESVPVTRTVTRYRTETRSRTVTRYREETRERTVTRYRDETRTRTVTRYRTETRTRTVTRHRQETRCCRPEQRQVFDRQVKIEAELRFAAETQLQGTEKETFTLRFNGDESQPQITVSPQSAIFKYAPVQRIESGRFSAEMKIVPAFQPSELGKETIADLRLLKTPAGPIVSFVDRGQRPRVGTRYALTITELATGQQVFATSAEATGAELAQIPVAAELSDIVDYVARLDVARAGLNLSAPVAFSATARLEFKRYTAEELGAQTVGALRLAETENQLAVRFRDNGAIAHVETVYAVTVSKKATGETVATAEFKAADVLKEQQATFAFPMPALEDKVDHRIAIQIRRSGPVVAAPFAFEIGADLTSKVDVASYKDIKKVGLFSIVGLGADARIRFTDATKLVPGVQTKYDLVVHRKTPQGKRVVLANGVVAREDLETDAAGKTLLPFARLQASAADLNAFVKKGASVEVTMTVQRSGRKLGPAVKWVKKVTLTVP